MRWWRWWGRRCTDHYLQYSIKCILVTAIDAFQPVEIIPYDGTIIGELIGGASAARGIRGHCTQVCKVDTIRGPLYDEIFIAYFTFRGPVHVHLLAAVYCGGRITGERHGLGWRRRRRRWWRSGHGIAGIPA